MPELDDHLHYRMVDVSSVKELARRWFPRVYFAQPAKGLAHRALADIIESVRELAYYRRTLFVPAPGPSSDAAQAAADEVVGSFAGTARRRATRGRRRCRRHRPRRRADRLRYRCAGSPPALAPGGDMVGVAQLVEHQVVILGVAGSSPVTHPTGEALVSSLTRAFIRSRRRRRAAIGTRCPLVWGADRGAVTGRLRNADSSRRCGWSFPTNRTEHTHHGTGMWGTWAGPARPG